MPSSDGTCSSSETKGELPLTKCINPKSFLAIPPPNWTQEPLIVPATLSNPYPFVGSSVGTINPSDCESQNRNLWTR